MDVKIAPSILSADFGRLNEDIKTIEPYADLLHVDVMDGNFVPNITIGPCVVRKIKTKLPIDVHLMISEPLKYGPEFAKAGASMISFHGELFESDKDGLVHAVEEIKKLNVKVGVVLNPDKRLEIIKPVLDKVDFVLLMSVYAGFGGQKFIPEVLEKIKDLRKIFSGDIQVDGGINDKTAELVVKAGANVLVAGTYIFDSKDRKKAIESLKR
ncbi:ribulose-phosphate 3-epimerase [Candidatus Woesearchaeota archaeon]|nr:ribulose-phosphate 3-epimerase [Candidatus Woesearchaeota archaeon]